MREMTTRVPPVASGSQIFLAPGDPLYEHLQKTNPKKLERLMQDEMRLYLETHAPDYGEQVRAASARVEQRRQQGPDYQLLGLDHFAGAITRQRVVAAYRKMARLKHPDAGGNHEAMVQLTAAYQRILAGLRNRTE